MLALTRRKLIKLAAPALILPSVARATPIVGYSRVFGCGWTPAQISTLVWFDASNVANFSLSGSLVDQWNDLSGNGNHITATSTARPTRNTVTNLINGLAVVTFNGSTNFLDKAGTTGFPAGSTGYTFVSVTRATSVGGPFALHDQSPNTGTNANALFFVSVSGLSTVGLVVRYDGAATDATQTAAGDITTVQIWSGFSKTNKRIAYINGVAGATVTTAGTDTTPINFRVGALFSGGLFPYTGDMGEIIGYSGEDDTTRVLAQNYLACKWGVTL